MIRLLRFIVFISAFHLIVVALVAAFSMGIVLQREEQRIRGDYPTSSQLTNDRVAISRADAMLHTLSFPLNYCATTKVGPYGACWYDRLRLPFAGLALLSNSLLWGASITLLGKWISKCRFGKHSTP